MSATIQFRLAAPLLLPNRKGIARSRAAGAARVKRERIVLASEVMVLTVGRRPVAPFRYAAVRVFRHSVQEPDTDNLYAACKGLLDVLQPATAKRVFGLGIIANDKPNVCHIEAHHVPAARRLDQCTVVEIRELSAGEMNAHQTAARLRALGEVA
ncbi:MAG: hypothetical protein PHU07_11380 [Acidocella sp.]|nr:hypothetical protein [Acidocella sp.]